MRVGGICQWTRITESTSRDSHPALEQRRGEETGEELGVVERGSTPERTKAFLFPGRTKRGGGCGQDAEGAGGGRPTGSKLHSTTTALSLSLSLSLSLVHSLLGLCALILSDLHHTAVAAAIVASRLRFTCS